MNLEDVDARFIDQINGDALRVVYCVPGTEDLVKEYAAAHGWDDIMEVRGHPALIGSDPSKIHVIDEQAAKAAVAAFHQRQQGGGL